MSKSSSFYNYVIAKLKGDDNELIAIRNERLASSNLKAQIAIKEGGLVGLESAVEDAKERLKDAIMPSEKMGTDEFSGQEYIERVLAAKNSLSNAEENLSTGKETLDFLKETLESFK